MYNESSKKATRKYMDTHIDKLTLGFPKGKKEKYKNYANSQGMSLTALITKLIEEDMKKHNEEV